MNNNEFDITRQFNNLINKWYSSALADPTIKTEAPTEQRRVVVAERNMKTESAASEALTNASVTQAPAPVDFGGKKLNPIERDELYSETSKLTSELEKLLNAYVQEKKYISERPINYLNGDLENRLFGDPDDPDTWYKHQNPLLQLLREVKNQLEIHPQWESEALAQWIARNTTHEYKAGMKDVTGAYQTGSDDYVGAYKPFHQLLQVINKISENVLGPSNEMDVEAESLETAALKNGLSYVDQSALTQIEEFKNTGDIFNLFPKEIMAHISQSLGIYDIGALKVMSKAGAKTIDKAFIEDYSVYCLNHKIMSVHSVEQLLGYLGKKAIDLQVLGDHPVKVNTQLLNLLAKSCPNLIECALIGGVQKGEGEVYPLDYKFDKLKTLYIQEMGGKDAAENILNACPNISSFTCVSSFSEKIFSINLPNINELNIEYDDEIDLTRIGNFPTLKTLGIYECILTDAKPLANCPFLVSLSIVNNSISPNEVEIIGDLPNLKVFQTNAEIEDYSFLSQAQLEHFQVRFHENITDLDFLKNSSESLSQLEMLFFDPQILFSLKNFPNLTKLVVSLPYDHDENDEIGDPIDLSCVLDCEKLEILVIDYGSVGDFGILNKIPSLKEVWLIDRDEPYEKDIDAIKRLEEKGVEVIIQRSHSFFKEI